MPWKACLIGCNMNREHVKGAADKVKGTIKDTAGKLGHFAFGLKRLPEMKLERLPRMADFAKWVVEKQAAL